MLRFLEIEHYDDFEDLVIFWVAVQNPPIEVQEKAKEIDGENYLDSCFGVCINYEKDENKFCLITDWDGNLYYIDNNGDKHWFNVNIEDNVIKSLFNECQKELNKTVNQ